MVMLHAYILRELLKSFGLCLLALTALFTMGGGLYKVLNFEGVTTGDLFTVLPLLIPIVVTLTMPIAALFAATITYGRIAADNEFVAARAAGINIHRLFLSAILLSLFVTLFSLLSVNLVIPRFMKSIEMFALTHIRDLAYNRLIQSGYIRYAEQGKDRYTLVAQEVKNVAEKELIAKGFEPPSDDNGYFWVERPTFIMSDKNGELRRFSVAEGGLVQFNTRDAEVKLTLYVKSARIYEGGRVIEPEFQKIGPLTTEIPFTPKPAMVDLATLRRWETAPWEAPKILQTMEKATFLRDARRLIFQDALLKKFAEAGRVVFHDPEGSEYTIAAASAVAAGDKLALDEVEVVRRPAPGDTERPVLRYEAPLAKLQAKTEQGETRLTLDMQRAEERRVREFVTRADGYGTQREYDDFRLENLVPPDEILERIRACTPQAVLDPKVVLPPDPELEKSRKRLWSQALELQRKIEGVIHFRFSFALSALVTIIMGAALGVMFRGSRALAAFGLACVPFAIVAVLIFVGKQMVESEGGQNVGPFLIWGGLALVGLADAVILRVGVRR